MLYFNCEGSVPGCLTTLVLASVDYSLMLVSIAATIKTLITRMAINPIMSTSSQLVYKDWRFV